MEITRENIIVNPQNFLIFLSGLDKVNTYNYNCIENSLSIDAFETWDSTDDNILDAGITENSTSIDYLKIKIENVVINSIREFTKKYRKESSIQDKIENYTFEEFVTKAGGNI